VLERPGEACSTSPARAPARHIPSREFDTALGREVEAAEDVDQSRLAGAVWADQADNLVPVKLERDLPKRVDTGERARDSGGPKLFSGPPILTYR